MAPQATTSIPASSTKSASTDVAEAVTAAGVDNTGLSQAQVGGLIGGILGAAVLVLLIWYWATHTTGYLEYHYNNRYYYHGLRGWPQQQNQAHSVYGAEYSYDGMEEETADVNPSTRSRRRQRQRSRQPEMTAEQYNAMVEAEVYAAAQAWAQESARQGYPPGVAVADDYVLSNPPLQFPPTTQRPAYCHSAYPQFPGVSRYP